MSWQTASNDLEEVAVLPGIFASNTFWHMEFIFRQIPVTHRSEGTTNIQSEKNIGK